MNFNFKKEDLEDLKRMLSELIKIDGGFDRKIIKSDFDFISSFLQVCNFDSINIIEDENLASNLFAFRIGDFSRPEEIDLCFLGHLDVVEPGNWMFWKNQNPFDLLEENGILFGRGAVDMKASIAAFLKAVSKLENQKFNLGIMICSDEEKESLGAQALRNYILKNDIKIKQILIGEPTSEKKIGDVLKIGRRGSANFDLILHGSQGHVAYPQFAKNPINESFGDLIKNLVQLKFNDENEFFDSSNLVITKIETGPGSARNVSPDFVKISFNIRYGSAQTLETLREILQDLIEKSGFSEKNSYDLKVFSNFSSFLSKKTEFYSVLTKAIQKICGYEPQIKTNGGTSDGRFFHDLAPIIELGPLNDSAHKINEHISENDLFNLYKIYYLTLEKFIQSLVNLN